MRLPYRPNTTAVLAASVFCCAAASAAALTGLVSQSIGSGTSAVTSCDSDGLTVTHMLSGTIVTDVTVGDISVACAGGELVVTVSDGTGAEVSASASTTVPGGGGDMTVALSPAPDVSTFTHHHLRITGP